MGQCYITRRGTKTGGAVEQLGIYPTGNDGRPMGNVTVLDNVTALSKYPFIENDNVLTIALPENLISLADYCFQNCTSLQNISIPNKVTAIPKYCFDGCTKLTSINIPDKVTTIGEKAFYNCTNLTSVIVSENAKYTIGQYAFNKSGLTDSCVTDIVSHASTINPHIFDGCESLINVVVPAFANYMFSNCVNLKTAKSTGSSTISSTGAYTFHNSAQLESVVIADGTTTIENCVFRACTSLKTVYLPSSITTATNNCLTATSASYYVFFNCTALEDVQLGQDWNMSLRLNASNNLTVDSMVAMFNSLKDLTGDTAKTLTLGSTNLAKLTDEQKLIATNKNWTLA